MIWNSMRFLFVLLLLSVLMACGGFGTQSQPTPSPVLSATSTPMPTNTPEPTDTPLPTNMPAPTPTATITPTPTPQIGETRINPETGQEEVFSDPGEWVEIVKIWNVAELGWPKGLTKDNASFKEGEENIIISWTQTNEEADDFGQKYEYEVPVRGKKELYGFDGNKAPVNLKVVFSIDGKADPSITMIPKQGETLAKFDAEQGWIDKFDVIMDGLDEQELENWMPQELGCVGILAWKPIVSSSYPLSTYRLSASCRGIEDCELIVGEIDYSFSYDMSFITQPKKVVVEKMWWQGEVSKEITWLVTETKFNDITFTIIFPFFISERPTMSSILEINKDSNINLETSPFLMDEFNSPPRTLDEILEIIKKSPLINLEIHSDPDKLIATFNTTYNKLNKPLGPLSPFTSPNYHSYLYHTLEQDKESRDLQKQLLEMYFNPEIKSPAVPDSVYLGFSTLTFLTTSEN